MRVKQKSVARGSLRWVRQLIYSHPDKLRAALALPGDPPIRWVSPRPEDDHAEYRDQAALDLLGISCEAKSLREFWPSQGPQWDALGRFGERGLILLEAKANLAEMQSPPSQASETSLAKIKRACEEAKSWLRASPDANWVGKYYQYANRLAHLYFFREINQLDAHLVFLYFLNDPDTGGPSSREAWAAAIGTAHKTLGLTTGLPIAVHDVFIDVRDLM